MNTHFQGENILRFSVTISPDTTQIMYSMLQMYVAEIFSLFPYKVHRVVISCAIVVSYFVENALHLMIVI